MTWKVGSSRPSQPGAVKVPVVKKATGGASTSSYQEPASGPGQGLTRVDISAQLERFLWVRECI